MGKELFEFVAGLQTEQRNPETTFIDREDALGIVSMISNQDARVADAVFEQKASIAALIDAISARMEKGGRLIYAGAGTSGRIGVIDAAECPPTFGTDPGMIMGVIAGGPEAMFVAQEGAEDRETKGAETIRSLNITPEDTIVGLAASGRTPFVWGALDEGKRAAAFTALVACVPVNHLPKRSFPDLLINVDTGAEVIMGSTRMKAATAQKMVCNMITTGAMIRLGKVYENVMVDLKITNEKLVERAIRVVMMFSGLSYDVARELLNQAEGHVKTALVMHKKSSSLIEAKSLLNAVDGRLSDILS